MRERISLDGSWRGFYGTFCLPGVSRAADCRGLKEIPATVPGAFETDLEAAGILPELYRGENILKVQDWENAHYCLSRTFEYREAPGMTDTLVFEGLDCYAEVFLDGTLLGRYDNMLIPHRIPLDGLGRGTHELFVHFIPATVAARRYDVGPYEGAQRTEFDALRTRKAPHMYGWDIMPRAVSCGIWRHVYIERLPAAHIRDVFAYTVSASEERARVRIVFNTEIGSENINRYFVRITGRCGDSVFTYEDRLWHTGYVFTRDIERPKIWWPHNYGDPDRYTLTAELFEDGDLVDTYETSFGIRTVVLDRTSTTDRDGHGEFCFRINGKKIFAMGSNWVPVDAFHWRDEQRLPTILPMLADLGCNIVRCWGGNVYENDLFYEFCDAHGIMIWQDFAMACGVYPQDREFLDAMRTEVSAVVKRLRNHPSIVLWAGDNECDCAYAWGGEDRDPNDNRITREVIPDVLRVTDPSRPYLPSSPYIDEEAYRTKGEISENHLWGPRDYFKGDYYRNTVCHFASETGYHGCPSPESLAKYIDPDHLWPCLGDRQWLVHAATMDGCEDSPYGYRIRLMWNQVETLFGKGGEATANLDAFSLASQISQAEAKKYFIERFRLSKWRRTGIIWWNLIDGWPQISDAIVDYYLDKKLAYAYIKRSQKPFCLMFDEPADGRLALYAVNDTREEKTFSYTVEDDHGSVILSGTSRAEPDTSVPIASIPATDEKRYFLIRWDDGKEQGINHYFANIRDIDFGYYQTLLQKLGD
ncbi:MAG: hypothetical protein K6G29_04325 [Clostridiales bacterium]|nr:hypothetical protein [Clostridiales bacterium]